jgi:hypothetical protein
MVAGIWLGESKSQIESNLFGGCEGGMMSEKQADELKASIDKLTTRQLWALIVWLFAEWVQRNDEILKGKRGKDE